MLPLDILNLLAALLAAAFAAFTLYRNAQRFALSYAVSIPFSAFFFFAFGTTMPALVMVLSIISGKYLYSKVFFLFAPIILGIGAAFLYLGVGTTTWAIYDISIGIGTALALFSDKQSMSHVSANNKSKGVSKAKEISRDLVQILGGILILVLLFTVGQTNFRIDLSLAVIPLYMFGNYYSLFPASRIGKTLTFFERPMTPLGLGAIWFAAGIMIALGVVDSTPLLAIIVFVTTIGDPLATIFGSMIKSPRLPYNRKKSIAGFLGIFIFSAIFAYFLIGYVGIAIALVSAFVESVSLHPFDDNFILPVILGAISYII